MIEIICKDEPEKAVSNDGEETVFLPKNIRQVGSPRGRHRIYLEDYVYTYLRSESKNKDTCAAVFLGKSRVVKDIRYTFVSGVVECSAAVFQWENISLDESFWDYIYKEQKQFFPEMDIVGWVLGKAGQAMELAPSVEAAHRKYFAGRDKILMLIDILEGEELFYVYEQGYLQKREGYYIYYEKNLAMQEYMIYKREEEMRLAQMRYNESLAADDGEIMEDSSENADGQAEETVIKTEQFQNAQPVQGESKTQAEEALESYRQMLLERQGRKEERQSRRFLYTASSFFLVVLCVIGITTINNYRKMQEVEDVLNVMSRGFGLSADKGTGLEEENDAFGEEEPLVVETIESQIEPLAPDVEGEKETEQSSENKEKQDSSKEAGEEADEGKQDDADKAADEGGQDDSNRTADEGEQDDADKATGEGEQDNADKTADEPSDKGQGESQETAAVPERYYTVQAGDTLNSICLNIYKNKSMVNTIKELNGIEDGDKILVGQKLLLP